MSIDKSLKIKRNVILAKYTTFRIGGPAKFFVEVNSPDELVEVVRWAREKGEKYFILGGGSNVLFRDKGYDGLVIRMKNKELRIKNKIIDAGAGVMLSELLKLMLDNNLSGLEWAAGIPGTVGGAVYGNAGANGGCMADVVESVEVFDGKEIKVLQNKDLKFGYRTSVFKPHLSGGKCTSPPDKGGWGGFVILSVKLKLKQGNKEQSKKLVKKYLIGRKVKQPRGFSAGSIFKNPSLPPPHTPPQAGGATAGKLIEQCGLKGLKIGDAQISEQHGNFIINLGNAKALDVLALIERVKNEVDNKFGITLEEEVQIV
jgi:UDP-N-acetylmuramate dehydrogenase